MGEGNSRSVREKLLQISWYLGSICVAVTGNGVCGGRQVVMAPAASDPPRLIPVEENGT
jgi:hypothetical protein